MSASAVPPVVCTGIIRSGWTWSFNVCRHLADLTGRRRGEQVMSGFLKADDLERWFAEGTNRPRGPAVVKAHDVGPKALAALRAGAVRSVCTIRDPRDCVVSDVAFNRGWLDASVRRVSANLSDLPYYLSAGNTLFVRYEEMVANPLRQVARIAAHMGVDADPIDLGRIDAMTGLHSARATAAGLRYRPAVDLEWCDGRRVDPITQLHGDHIRTGRVGGWRDELTAAEQGQVSQAFHPWLVELGYEPARKGASVYA